MLTLEQRTRRIAVCQDWTDRVAADPDVIRRIITGDESWVWAYEPETKRQSCQWIQPKSDNRPQKYRQSKSTLKIMIAAFFDIHGLIHVEFVTSKVTAEVYIDILMNLRDSIRQKRQQLWRDHDWILLDDNASVHTADDTEVFRRQVRMERGPHPPYSPDLAPCDFFLFPKLKSEMRGKRYANLPDLKRAVHSVFDSFSQEDWQECFHKLQDHWQRCVSSEGHYF